MNKVYGAAKPSLDEALAHHGVKGQRWGVRRRNSEGKTNRQLNRESRQRDRAKAAATNKRLNTNRNKTIDAARQRVKSGQTKAEYRAARKQYKIDKRQIGTREARKNLNAAKLKRMTDIQTANQVKSGRETTIAVIGAVGSVALSTALKSAAASNGRRASAPYVPRAPYRTTAYVNK
jgi:hypothetical protein